ncbi:SGNH/GDSL hydrolase family protein [Sphingomonas bacterium]|uniref:SGNH/GDSL hydrolase family protein n=1 Tax=Sphingomonas bacterium TaxID=1895847 RepID=UPI0020C5D25A|nr:SGNH/GDSL hydrolase family protein [Sphingomonas bacterium]
MGTVAIVAIGSSSTAGAYASPGADYPSVMRGLLAAHPEVAAFTVYNKGRDGDDLRGTQSRLQTDVIDLHPRLVILQAGTNDAASPLDSDLQAYTDRLRSVVSQLKGVAQVVLMNGQHYATEPAIYSRYVDAMETVSAEQNIPIFDRYGLMKSWVDTGTYKYADILASDSFHPDDFTYHCMGQVMAELTLARTSR